MEKIFFFNMPWLQEFLLLGYDQQEYFGLPNSGYV